MLSCGNLDAVLAIDVDKGTVTVESGVSLDTLLRVLLPLGWFPMVIPGTSYVTVGGAIASDIHGKYRHGSFADYVERMRIVTPAHGRVARSSPTPTPTPFWATSGGMGLTGVITEATLRAATGRDLAHRLRHRAHRRRRRLHGAHARRRPRVPLLRRVDRLPRAGRPTRAGGAVAAATTRPSTTSRPPTARPRAPTRPARCSARRRGCPNGLINLLTVRAFNEVWYRKAPRTTHRHVEGIKPFFFPLDGVRDWNRVYGSAGFVQYQFVVPFGAEQVVRTALERFSAARVPTFLAVLKRFEHDSRSLIGFPMSGWTLALDIPASPVLGPLLDGLDELVVAAGGRVYLTKDSRLRPELLAAMYPRLDEWRATRAGLDPDNRLRSDMDRRLDLSGGRPA